MGILRHGHVSGGGQRRTSHDNDYDNDSGSNHGVKGELPDGPFDRRDAPSHGLHIPFCLSRGRVQRVHARVRLER